MSLAKWGLKTNASRGLGLKSASLAAGRTAHAHPNLAKLSSPEIRAGSAKVAFHSKSAARGRRHAQAATGGLWDECERA